MLRAVSGGSGGGGIATSVVINTTVVTGGTSGDILIVNGDGTLGQTAALTVALDQQTGTTYTVPAGDKGALLTTSNVASIAVTLPQATGSFTTGFSFTGLNIGAGVATYTPTTSTLAGLASVSLRKYDALIPVSDGVNWQAVLVPGSLFNITANNLIVGGGAGTSPSSVTPGTGVLTALQANVTGSGAIVLANTPTLITPVLGVATGTGITLTEAVGSSALTLTGATQVANHPVLDATQTWNAAGVVMMADRVNVTSTVGTTSSLFSALTERQYNGSTWFRVGAQPGPYATIWLGTGITPSASNWNLASTGGNFLLNAGAANGSIQASINNGVFVFSIDGVGSGTHPNIVLGSNSALATSATDGFVYVPSMAGTPTGVPRTYTARIALVYDTTNDQLWAYNGSWKQPKTPAGAAVVNWQ